MYVYIKKKMQDQNLHSKQQELGPAGGPLMKKRNKISFAFK